MPIVWCCSRNSPTKPFYEPCAKQWAGVASIPSVVALVIAILCFLLTFTIQPAAAAAEAEGGSSAASNSDGDPPDSIVLDSLSGNDTTSGGVTDQNLIRYQVLCFSSPFWGDGPALTAVDQPHACAPSRICSAVAAGCCCFSSFVDC